MARVEGLRPSPPAQGHFNTPIHTNGFAAAEYGALDEPLLANFEGLDLFGEDPETINIHYLRILTSYGFKV